MLALSLSFAVALLDQLSKYAIRSSLCLGHGREVIPGWFDLRYVQNTGAAWGVFEGLNHWLVPLSLAMLVVMARFRRHFMSGGRLPDLAAGLIGGGIVGNLLDRVRLGYVVDFLDFHWRGHAFPAFNLADAAICTGVGLYMLSELRGWNRPAAEPAAPNRTAKRGSS